METRNPFASPVVSMVLTFRRMAMPTAQKPQLGHVLFPWHEQSTNFTRNWTCEGPRFLSGQASTESSGIPVILPASIKNRKASHSL
jgi:hypothetical protein